MELCKGCSQGEVQLVKETRTVKLKGVAYSGTLEYWKCTNCDGYHTTEQADAYLKQVWGAYNAEHPDDPYPFPTI